MPPAPPEGSTANTPLAPSVEKAYYRKCIELKRRLNEVEATNDEAKIRRVRLDRAIMKMRLERAFILEQLSKRMEVNVDGSDDSADEAVNTPPPDRPHRDKRRKQESPKEQAARNSSPVQQGKPHSRPASRDDGRSRTNGADRMDIDRKSGVVGEALDAGPAPHQDANGQRVISAHDRDPALDAS